MPIQDFITTLNYLRLIIILWSKPVIKPQVLVTVHAGETVHGMVYEESFVA